jgi:hypothetical protein
MYACLSAHTENTNRKKIVEVRLSFEFSTDITIINITEDGNKSIVAEFN